MGRYALIQPDGTVDNVIVASPEIATAIAAQLGCTAREVVTELETAATPDAIRSRSCEPGARLVTRDATDDERSSGRARREGAREVVDDFERETEAEVTGDAGERTTR